MSLIVKKPVTEKNPVMPRIDEWGGLLGLPDVVEIEPTETCNLRCKMCHVSYMSQKSRPALDANLVKKLACLRGKYVIIGSAFEPTMNRGFEQMIHTLTDLDCRLELITNGVLLKDGVKSALLDANLEEVTFSFDGISKESYERVRRGANYDDVLENIVEFRSALAGRDTYFGVNSTVMRSNMHEISAAPAFWDQYGFDRIGFIYMVIRDLNEDLVRESLYPVRHEMAQILDTAAEDVIQKMRKVIIGAFYFANSPLRDKYPNNFKHGQVVSDHPGARRRGNYRNSSQLGAFPGMPLPCKSPFTFARIMANGDVQLCYKFTIGNLNEASFEDIWYGKEANAARLKAMLIHDTCATCDYYRFCLAAGPQNIDAPSGYFMQELIPEIPNVNFTTGEIKGGKRFRSPELIKSFQGHNIVLFKDSYYVLPQSLGPVDLDTDDAATLPGVAVKETLPEAMAWLRSQNY